MKNPMADTSGKGGTPENVPQLGYRIVPMICVTIMMIVFVFWVLYTPLTSITVDTEVTTYETKYKMCPCNGKEIAVPMKMCLKESGASEPEIGEMCNADHISEDICSKYKNCKTCLSGLRKCFSCPEGRSGDLCEHEVKYFTSVFNGSTTSTEVYIPFGESVRANRKSRGTECDMPLTSATSEIRCTIWTEKVKCTQTCVWGHKVRGLTSQELTCEKSDGKWKPGDFTECERTVNCKVKLVKPGSLNCKNNVLREPEHCNISCEHYETTLGTVERKYECMLDGSFKPPLPFCAKVDES